MEVYVRDHAIVCPSAVRAARAWKIQAASAWPLARLYQPLEELALPCLYKDHLLGALAALDARRVTLKRCWDCHKSANAQSYRSSKLKHKLWPHILGKLSPARACHKPTYPSLSASTGRLSTCEHHQESMLHVVVCPSLANSHSP